MVASTEVLLLNSIPGLRAPGVVATAAPRGLYGAKGENPRKGPGPMGSWGACGVIIGTLVLVMTEEAEEGPGWSPWWGVEAGPVYGGITCGVVIT